MPAAIQMCERPHTWRSNVGHRKTPFSGQDYQARAPKKDPDSKRKNGIFEQIWLPVNASNRVVVDRQQDLMHIEYSLRRDNNDSFSRCLNRPREKKESLRFTLPVAYELTKHRLPSLELELKPAEQPDHVKIAMWKTGNNSLAPFASLGKPTCGCYFTRDISHKKRLIGINPTNTVKWRSNVDIINIKKS